ncbi:hypothetical protein Avbf_13087 [Armadillidium vulgare]|nr:hypothetical protein Avbf_13087 [Armadillidium vulgare]
MLSEYTYLCDESQYCDFVDKDTVLSSAYKTKIFTSKKFVEKDMNQLIFQKKKKFFLTIIYIRSLKMTLTLELLLHNVGLETEETKIKITTEVKESKTRLPSSNASIKNHNIINTKDDKSTEDLQKKKLQNATDRQEKEQQKPIPFKEKMSDEPIDAKGTKQSPIKSSSEEGFNTRSENILLISLGGGEDEILMSQMARLFYSHQKRVTLLLYGEHHREENLPDVKIITIPIGDDDPIHTQDSNNIGLTPEDSF